MRSGVGDTIATDPAGMDIERLAFVDVETTGANPVLDRVTEIGIVTVNDGQVSRWSSLVDPGCRIPPFIQALTGITPEMVAGAPTLNNSPTRSWRA